MQTPLTFAIAGLGSRGKDTYAPIIGKHPETMRLTAIADIVREKVDAVARDYSIAPELCFDSAEAMTESGKFADVMIISTQDRQHVGHAVRAMRLGYDILLEKPISPELDECRELSRVARETGRKVVVCHVLRYTPFYTKVKQLLSDGTIGDIVTVMAIENVGYWHQAHSFVRGNWRSSAETSPMILAKCCHDMDLYPWLCGKTCESVSSYGGTYLFRADKAPAGASDYCLNGCAAKEGCPFDAEKIYITNERTGARTGRKTWPLNVLTLNPTEESIYEAVKSGPYGRCVYRCDNDVVDHQVVNMNMTDGSTVSFTMSGLTSEIARWSKFMGTKGELIANERDKTIEIARFGEEKEIIDVAKLSADFSGHGGGDSGMIARLAGYIRGSAATSDAITTLEQSLQSHYIALGAEESRLTGKTVTLGSPV